MKIYKRIAGMFLAVLVTVLLLPALAFAEESMPADREGTLTLSCRDDDTPLAGVEFSIYLVATMDENGRLTPTETFSKYNIRIPEANEAAWKTLASTLEGCVLRDNITPADRGTTDQQGQLRFPSAGKKLLPGLYLLPGSRHSQNGRTYDIQSSMVLVPAPDAEAGDWNYDVTIEPKYESHPDSPGGITRKVLKVWKDAGYEGERPVEIEVQLLKDGKIHDTVKLNAGNNWRHTWEGLDDKSQWTVVEKETNGYTVTVAREGITFVVTNTWNRPGNPSDTPSGGPSTPGKPSQKLPQTGMLWWPVPFLMCAGILFIVAGLIRRRGVSDEEE